MEIIYEKDVDTQQIVVSPRPVWKCRPCPEYGKRPSCPPHAPSWKETAVWVKYYHRALLVKFQIDNEQEFDTEKRAVLRYLLDKEHELFRDHMYVFALFPGSCNLCPSCSFEEACICSDPQHVRPSLDAVGIELNHLVELNFDENVLYGMIFID